jgi:hypothetical protein
MTATVQHRRGTAAEHATFTGAEGEFTYDTDDKRIVAHDGLTAGGIPLAKESEAGIAATVAASGKTTPVDADLIGIADSADSNALKKLTFANLATWVGSKLGAIYVGLTGKTTPADADLIPISDSADSNATKKLTWANLKATLKTYLDTLYQAKDDTLTSLAAVAGVAGDILYASGADTWARLAKGTNGHVLTLSGGLPAWSAPAAASGGSVRNRIVNPAMQISSINGNTSGTSSGYAPADNWLKYHVSSAGTLTVQRVQSVTPKGAKDRIRVTITAADASLAAGEYLTLTQNIAGQEVADFQYGTASAKQVLLRFLFKGPQGTYAVALHNAAADRSYVALFTISAPNANVDTIQEITIAGDTTGTWTTTAATGLTLDIVLACGSTFQGSTGWQAGNILGTSGVSNGMATINDVFEIGEVGLYLDVAAAGTFPTWELPSFKHDYNFQAVVTPWVAYTPTFTGFGTVTNINFLSRRVGETLHVRGKCTAGTTTATEGRITLGFNGVNGGITIDPTNNASIRIVGTWGSSGTAVGSAAPALLAEASVSYMTFGLTNGSNAALTKQNGSTVCGTGTDFVVDGQFPITGW